jgi:hypothetical protein
LARSEHASEVQCGVTVLEVEFVHGGGELGAMVGIAEELWLVFVSPGLNHGALRRRRRDVGTLRHLGVASISCA